jgi:hypothetical protein
MKNLKFRVQFELSAAFAVLAVFFLLTGCQKAQTHTDGVAVDIKKGEPIVITKGIPPIAIKDSVPIDIAGGGPFPTYLAGVWRQAGQIEREFVISKDGHLLNMVLGLGRFRVWPNHETRVPLIEHGEAFFIPGPWVAAYDPKKRELRIEIEISSFRMQAGAQLLEGSILESFIGTISADGKQWEVNYVALPKYDVVTMDGKRTTLMDGSTVDEQKLNFVKFYSPYEPYDPSAAARLKGSN